MRILVIGSGGREHALCWKIAQSSKVDKIYCAPGNAGISDIAECADINIDDIKAILNFAKEKKVDITVVGPELPLALGITDLFQEQGLKIFGPSKYLAQLESSKVFAKEAMARFGLPTAGFKVFDDPEKAKEHILQNPTPIVVKADGLCAGKGVVVAQTQQEAVSAVDSIMVSRDFGAAGGRIIIEDCLNGEEASIILVSDGKDYILFPSSQDHKRAEDNDKGLNTGGMGAYSPAPVVTDDLIAEIEHNIIKPLLSGLQADKRPYKGVLYIGIMVVDKKPYILEFNVRFGDPETQAILPRLATDLIDIIEASVDGNIKNISIDFKRQVSVCVVCASGGYPEKYKKGLPIKGLDRIKGIKDLMVFHAGTKLTSHKSQDEKYETDGGRVLGVTALAEDIESARDSVYNAISKISFENMHYRKDIAS